MTYRDIILMSFGHVVANVRDSHINQPKDVIIFDLSSNAHMMFIIENKVLPILIIDNDRAVRCQARTSRTTRK